MKGIIKWFNNEKGYGFVECNNGEDIFIHKSAIMNNASNYYNVGDYIEFNLINFNDIDHYFELMKIKYDKFTIIDYVNNIIDVLIKNDIEYKKFFSNKELEQTINILLSKENKQSRNEENYQKINLIVSILGIVLPLVINNQKANNTVNIQNTNNYEINISETNNVNCQEDK